MLGILCSSRPKPAALCERNKLGVSCYERGVRAGSSRDERVLLSYQQTCDGQRQHSTSCLVGSRHKTGGSVSVWHAVFPCGAVAEYPTHSFHQHKGEGSWNVAWDKRPARWLHTSHSAWLLFGVCTCPVNQQSVSLQHNSTNHNDDAHTCSTKYRVIGVPGDGRCLFRAVSYGARLKCGEELFDEKRQIELADELRAQVTDELLKRRKEMEWIIEGDFDMYVNSIKRPNSWGGEPELLLASHVLRMPISVCMIGRRTGELVKISSYGDEYGNDASPIHVLFHEYGHYDVLVLCTHHVRYVNT